MTKAAKKSTRNSPRCLSARRHKGARSARKKFKKNQIRLRRDKKLAPQKAKAKAKAKTKIKIITVPIRHQRHSATCVVIFQNVKFFKELLQVKLKKPILKRLNLSTLKLEADALASKRGYVRRVDLLFSVQLKGSYKRIKIALLVEHKSYKDKGLVGQLLIYIMELRQTYKSVIPIVVTHDSERPDDTLPDEGRQFLELEPIRVPFFHIALSELDFDKLKGLTSAAAMLILGHTKVFDKYSKAQQIKLVMQALQHLPKLSGPKYSNLLKKLFYYVKDENPRMFNLMGMRVLLTKKKLPPRAERQIKEGLEMVNTAKNLWFDEDKFIQKGLKKGRQEGRQEGRAEGEKLGLVKGQKLGLVKGQKLGLVKGRQEGVKKGRQEGLVKGQQQILMQMLKRGKMQEVARLTGLSIQKLRRLKNKS